MSARGYAVYGIKLINLREELNTAMKVEKVYTVKLDEIKSVVREFFRRLIPAEYLDRALSEAEAKAMEDLLRRMSGEYEYYRRVKVRCPGCDGKYMLHVFAKTQEVTDDYVKFVVLIVDEHRHEVHLCEVAADHESDINDVAMSAVQQLYRY